MVIHSVKQLGLWKLNLEESYVNDDRMKTVKNQPEGFGVKSLGCFSLPCSVAAYSSSRLECR